MDYRGIDFDLKPFRPGIWNYRFQMGRAIKSGRIKAADQALAIHSVQKKINREIRRRGVIGPWERSPPDRPGGGAGSS